jgi:hypothetical protein
LQSEKFTDDKLTGLSETDACKIYFLFDLRVFFVEWDIMGRSWGGVEMRFSVYDMGIKY